MKIYYDTEFLDNGRTIKLISIGMVAEDGRRYYAVNSDAPWNRIRQNPWLCQNVVTSLPLTEPVKPPIMGGTGAWWFRIDHHNSAVKPRQVIANEVRDFIRASGEDVELWADYCAYDHVVLAQLYGPMIHLPSGIPMFTHDLRHEINRLGMTDDDLPQQADGLHNALADAEHNALIGRILTQVASRG